MTTVISSQARSRAIAKWPSSPSTPAKTCAKDTNNRQGSYSRLGHIRHQRDLIATLIVVIDRVPGRQIVDGAEGCAGERAVLSEDVRRGAGCSGDVERDGRCRRADVEIADVVEQIDHRWIGVV